MEHGWNEKISEAHAGNHSRDTVACARKDRDMLLYMRTWLELKADRRAVTALEYALMGSLIAVAIITAVTGLGTGMKTTFNTISNNL